MPVSTMAMQATVPSVDSIDYLILAIVARLNDVELAVETGNTVGYSRVMMTSHCSFTGRSRSYTAVGLVGCCKLLGDAMSGTTLEERAQCESWMTTAEQTLLPLVRDAAKKDSIFEAAVLDYFNYVEKYLLEHHQTYLVGDHPTIADVMVAISVAAVSTTALSKVVALPPQVYRHVTTILSRLQAIVRYTHITSWLTFGLETRNVLQEWLAVIECGTILPSSPPLESITPTAAVTTTVPMTTTTTTPAAAEAPLAAQKEKTKTPTAAAAAAAAASTTPTTTTGNATATSADAATTTTPATASSASSNNTDTAILALLTQYDIAYELYEHVPCLTAEELLRNVPLPVHESHTKNLFLRDKKHGLFLVSVDPKSHVNTKELGTLLGLTGKVNLRLADAALLANVLGVSPGSVGPLCACLPMAQTTTATHDESFTLVLDQALLSYEYVHSHPGRNDQSVKLTPAALLDILQQAGVAAPKIIEFGPAVVETGAAATGADGSKAAAAAIKVPPAVKAEKVNKDKKTVKKGETLLALQWKKTENFAMWYSDVIVLSEMISYYDISGCYILRPWSYKMWELIQEWFNTQIAAAGVENAYFPLFVSQERLEREKDHVEGFAPEVAWVTKSGSGDLAKPIAVRPTSETIMYPAYADWIRSHRDLPLKLNQWNNVVRWEFKYPTPFLRTREFLWQEGHTAHATFADADATVMQALGWYRGVYEELLAVPVVPGYKTEKEKFAGGFRTTTVEAYIAGSGRAIQGATSHNLGQNFGKMFGIKFQDEKGVSETAWQTSWGLTTRTIGVMVMVHGDDVGLVLPPRVAPLQVVIVPIVSKKFDWPAATPYCEAIVADLMAHGVRVRFDDRTMYNPGWKYNHWEQKGVPIRIEVGPRDVEQQSVRIVVRHDSTKSDHAIDGLGAWLAAKLVEIQQAMFDKAKAARDAHIVQVMEWNDFVPNLELNNMVLTPWCGGEHQDWEEKVKDRSREESLKNLGETAEDERTSTSVAAKTLCIPFAQPELPSGTKCFASGMDATCWVLWGRSY